MFNNGIEFKIVNVLPQTGESNIIYFLRTSNTPQNLYTEYVFLNGKWEILGKTNDENISKLKTDIDKKINNISSQLDSTVSKKDLASELSKYEAKDTIQKDIINTLNSNNYLKIKVLPTTSLPSKGEANILYLKPKSRHELNNYYEYVWVERTKAFERIGQRDIDIDAYLLKVDADKKYTDIDADIIELYKNKVNAIKINPENSSILHTDVDLNSTETVKTYTLSIDKATIEDNKVVDNTKNRLYIRRRCSDYI